MVNLFPAQFICLSASDAEIMSDFTPRRCFAETNAREFAEQGGALSVFHLSWISDAVSGLC